MLNTGTDDRCMKNWRKNYMIKSSIWSTCYGFIILYIYTNGGVLVQVHTVNTERWKQNMNWTVFIYIRAFVCLEVCAVCVKCYFRTRIKKNSPNNSRCSKNFQKCTICGTVRNSPPVMSYATHKSEITHLRTYIGIRSRTYKITCTNTHVHTRSLKTAQACAMCDLTWFYFRLFSVFFIVIVGVVLHRFWDIAVQCLLFLEQLFFSFLMLSFLSSCN